MNYKVTRNICRICAKEPPGGSIKHMQQIFSENFKMVQQIYDCSGVELKKNNKLPGKICRKCCTLLKYAVKFRATCRKSQEYFQNLVVDSLAETEPSHSSSVEADDDNSSGETSKKFPIVKHEDCINFVDIKEDLNSIGEDSQDIIPEESPLSQAYFVELTDALTEESQNIIPEESPLSQTLLADEIRSTMKEQDTAIENMPKEASEIEFMAKEEAEPVNEQATDIETKEAVPEIIAVKNDFKTRKKRKNSEGPKVFICEQCGNNFTCRHHFITHLRRHTGDKRFHCEVCPNKFFTHTELNRHMRRHTGERPFACKHCNRRFTDYSTRIKHERTHTNERPFACQQCTKAFTTSYILKNHMLIHTGERSFTCQLCNKSFQRQSHLVVHFRSIMHKHNAENAEGLTKDFANNG